MADNYLFDWSNTDIWQHDGSLSYDEENNVLFFDIEKKTHEEKEEGVFSENVVINIDNCDGWCKTELEIPNGMNSFNLTFTVANSASTGRGDMGCISAEFLNSEGEIIETVATAPIAGKKYFYEYRTQGQREDGFATIPENAEKLQVCIYGIREGNELDFYIKDIALEFDEKPYVDTPIAGINAVYVKHKADEKPVLIGQESALLNGFSWLGVALLVAGTATIIVLCEKRKKNSRNN